MFLAAICGFLLLPVALLIALGILKIPSLRTIYLVNQLPGPKCFPIVGYLCTQVAFAKDGDIMQLMTNNLEKYGGFFATWSFGSPSCVISDPDDIKAVLNNTKYITKANPYYLMKAWLGEGLLTSAGDKWKYHRKMLTPSFHNKFGEHSLGIMNRHADILVAHLLGRCGTAEDIWPLLRRFSLKIMCESGMGIVLDDSDEELRRYSALAETSTASIMQRATKPYYNREFIYKISPAGRKYYEGVEFLHQFTEKIIKKRRADFERNHSSADEGNDVRAEDGEPKKRHVPFLDKLLALDLEDREVREEVDTFALAGHDTTSAAIMFILFELGHHHDIQEKVYEEQMKIMGNDDRQLTANDLSKMVYLTAVIKEAIRLYPSAPLFARYLEEDITLPGGRVVPATTNITISIFHMQRNPKNYRDPTSFVPERFLHTRSEWNVADRHPFSYIPFSAGPRNCIGQKFAMVELKATISAIVRNVEIRSVTPRSAVSPGFDFIFRSKTPVLLRFSPRNEH